MPIDFTSPKTSDNYSTLFVPNIIANQLSMAKFLDSGTETITAGLTTGLKRYNATSTLFEKYTGVAWAEMPLAYLKLGGGTLTGAFGVTNAATTLSAGTAAGNDGWLKFTNTFSTVWNKYLRLGSNGDLNIVNSANTAVIANLTDAGQFSATMAVSGPVAVFTGAGSTGSIVSSVNNGTSYAGFLANGASGQWSYYFHMSAGVESARTQATPAGDWTLSNTASATPRFTVSAAGAATLFAPTTGNSTLTLNAVAGNNLINATDGTCNSVWFTNGASGIVFGTTTSHNVGFYTNNTLRYAIGAATGGVLYSGATGGATSITVNGSTSGGNSIVSGSSTAYTAGSSITGSSYTAQGPYGGGYALIDGTANISLFSISGSLNIAFGSSLGAMASRFTFSPTGNLVITASSGVPLIAHAPSGSGVAAFDGTSSAIDAVTITTGSGGIGLTVVGRASDNYSTVRFVNNAFSVEYGAIYSNSGAMGFNYGGATRFSVSAGIMTINSGAYTPTNTVTFGATLTVNAALSNAFSATLTGNVTTFTVSNLADGQSVTVRFVQDATGSRTIAWGTLKWPGGSVPALSTAANAVDVLVLSNIAGVVYATLSKGHA
jgi:hypothetical protein